MAMSTRVVLVLMAYVPCAVPALSAQHRSPLPLRRWEISVTLGGSHGPATTQFESAINSACFSCDPSTRHSGATAGLVITHLVRGGWGLRGEWVSADLGESSAYVGSLAWLSLHTTVTSVGVSAMLSIGDVLRIGAGPVLNVVHVTRTDGGNGTAMDAPAGPGAQTTRAGFVVYGGIASPSSKRVFAEVAVQRSIVGAMDVGPSAGSSMLAVPATHVSFSYTTIRMALGLRF